MSGGSTAGQVVSRSAKRLTREFQEMEAAGLFPCEIQGAVHERWIVTMRGAEGTFYAGEVFKLQFTFPKEYPIDSPEVIFLPPAPIHPHIYTNGHICLSILYQGGWSPALKVESVCMSILSMLSSAEAKRKPEDNDRYVSTCKQSPKQTSWVFHDNKA